MQRDVSDSLDAVVRKIENDPAWKVADSLRGPDVSVWRLERVKTEAELISRMGEDALDVTDASSDTFAKTIFRSIAFACTAFAAFMYFTFYLMTTLYMAKSKDLPTGTARIVAVHGEWSTRTRHILGALPGSDPPISAILLLGRQHQSPEKIKALWSGHVPMLQNPPILMPVTFRAALAALRDMPDLLRDGLREAFSTCRLLGAREETALAFRVYLGAAQARWWRQQRHESRIEVLFGMAGTADITLLEKAIQKTGGETVHIVHGQAIGPNFAGVSDYAMFKSKFDALAYNRLKCYKNCLVKGADSPEPRRGRKEILLLSNLAHPMNAGFRRQGIRDEVSLLECISRAADLLHVKNMTLSWKPHPVIHELEPALVEQLRDVARSLGFVELPTDTSLAEASKDARWTLCSPSTVATDLLQMGTLSLVLDPQRSVGSSAISVLPGLNTLQPEALAALMADLDKPDKYDAVLRQAYSIIEPAGPLDLSAPLHL